MLPIPLVAKVMGGWLLDRIDCMSDWWPKRGPLFTHDTRICHTLTYSLYDKVGDTLLNTLLLYATHQVYPQYTPFLMILYLIRVIGITRFFKTHNKKNFIYFPNFFITTVLILSIFKHLTWYMIVGIFVYQMLQEIYMHGSY
jgi:hypothetical protein